MSGTLSWTIVMVTAVSQETNSPYTTAMPSFHLSGGGLLAMLDLTPWKPSEGLLASPANLPAGSLPLLDSSELERSRVLDHLSGEWSLWVWGPVPSGERERLGLRQYFVWASG